MEMYKFELIRADESQQIEHVVTHKFRALLASSVVADFVDFMLGCGFAREAVVAAFAEHVDACDPDALS